LLSSLQIANSPYRIAAAPVVRDLTPFIGGIAGRPARADPADDIGVNGSAKTPEPRCAPAGALPDEGTKLAAATCKPLRIMALLPEIAGKTC
jgi:hypothetical protein